MKKSNQKYNFTLTDLIDTLTIEQIKEVKFSDNKREICNENIKMLSSDIDFLLRTKDIKPTAKIFRLISFISQANLYVWENKEEMQVTPQKYYELLEFAQELNGLRNYARNLLMQEFGELKPSTKRVTFLELKNKRWYTKLIKGFTYGRKSY